MKELNTNEMEQINGGHDELTSGQINYAGSHGQQIAHEVYSWLNNAKNIAGLLGSMGDDVPLW